MFRQNTAAFVHELPAGDVSNIDGASNYVRVQVLTNAGALGHELVAAARKQIAELRQSRRQGQVLLARRCAGLSLPGW
jgi:hypothetical protein